MPRDVFRTAVASYDDGSEGVIRVNVIRPPSGEQFLSLDSPDTDGGLVVGTKEQSEQLIKALQAANATIWEDE